MLSNFQNPQASVGVGLRSKYFEYFLTDIPQIPIRWLEVHPENYVYHYPNRKKLQQISEKFPISFHCISLSLGSPELPDKEYLDQLKKLMKDIPPILFSDHLSWSNFNGRGYNDLLPLPMTESSLQHVAMHVRIIQEFFDRQILIENPSTYVTFKNDSLEEYEFLNRLAEMTGCGILLDVNNLYVQSINHGVNIPNYLRNLNWNSVQEIHLAGYTKTEGSDFLVDTHSKTVSKSVWKVYCQALYYKRDVHSLIEWDADLPEINVLLGEAEKAAACYEALYV